MNDKYLAGFFDGEGSAMVLTIRRQLQMGVVYRFRPTIKIAQKTSEVLDAIKDHLEVGFVLHSSNRNSYVINELLGILRFTSRVGRECYIKRDALNLVEQLAEYQSNHIRNIPYTRDEIIWMIEIRDRIHQLNTLTRSNIQQKYSKDDILAEHSFVNIREWQLARATQGAKALEEAGKPYRFMKGESRASFKDRVGKKS